MSNDTIWTEELIKIANNNSLEELIDWCGNVIETQFDHKGNPIYFVRPENSRINQIVINIDNNLLDRIGIFGGDFQVSFNWVSAKFKEFKRTFNTYDPIDDEQFIFYPTNELNKLHACDSWISPNLQKVKVENLVFKNINFYFSSNKIPYHFRDGWHLIDPIKYPN